MVPGLWPLRLATSPAAAMLTLFFQTLLLSLIVVFAAESSTFILPSQLHGYDFGSHLLSDAYESEPASFDRHYLGRRASFNGFLENNRAVRSNLESGVAMCFQLEKRMVFGDGSSGAKTARMDATEALGNTSSEAQVFSRQQTQNKTVYISANTCLQPFQAAGSEDEVDIAPPQLTLLISNSSQLGCPDMSMQDRRDIEKREFDNGAVTIKLNYTDDLFITVQAANVSSSYRGVYSFELAASTDNYYHEYEAKAGQLLWLDSDASSALLVSKNLTTNEDQIKAIMDKGIQYQFYLDNEKFPRLQGVQHSSCGLRTLAPVFANFDGQGSFANIVHMTMTTRGPGGFPKQQFYITDLNDTTPYRGYIVRAPNTTKTGKTAAENIIGGGGTVFASTNFNTTSGTSCKMVTNLDFCDDVQYAVPGNDAKFQDQSLAKKYDDYARELYGNFEKALMQVQCEAPSTKRYSLLKDCGDCKKAYKIWLCTVVMPRCEDLRSNSAFSIVRNAGQPFPNGTVLPADELSRYSEPAHNTSRSKFVDDEIAPGPYRELLPCDDLCNDVVQSCPAQLKFACPRRDFAAYSSSYARRDPKNKDVTCNYPGEPRTRISSALPCWRNATSMSYLLIISIILLF